MQKGLPKKAWKTKNTSGGAQRIEDFFIGLKLTLALESKTLKPLAVLINEANVPEPKIYHEIFTELKRRRIIQAGDIVYAD